MTSLGHMGRLAGKTAIIVGAGQTPGETIGNGKAPQHVRPGRRHRSFAWIARLDRAEPDSIRKLNKRRKSIQLSWLMFRHADTVRRPGRRRALARMGPHRHPGQPRRHRLGRRPPHVIDEDAYDFIAGHQFEECCHDHQGGAQIMREQRGGAILSISSLAAWAGNDKIALGTPRPGWSAISRPVIPGNAKYGVRANVILPGLMDTPDGHRRHLHRQGHEPRGCARSAMRGCRWARWAPAGTSRPAKTPRARSADCRLYWLSRHSPRPGRRGRRRSPGPSAASIEPPGWSSTPLTVS